MKEKIKKFINIKRIGKVGLALTSLFCYTNTCFAAIQDSKIVTGTESLISDLTGWLLVLAPVLTILLVGYFFLRKAASDEMDAKRWDNRIKVAIISCGINNRYHHPSQKIIERFKAFNIQTKITQQEGQIKICSDGNSFQVKGFLYN